MKKLFLTIILLASLTSLVQTAPQGINLSVNIPSSQGNFRNAFLDYFRFIPLSSPPEASGSCQSGGFYTQINGKALSCTNSYWSSPESTWKYISSNNALTPGGWPPNADIKIGVFTNSAELMFDLNGESAGATNDGMIITGDYGASGTTLADAKLGAGTKLVWYTKKAAFRAGSVDSTQWINANIGDFSVAFGQDNVASAFYSLALGGSDNVVSGAHSTALGNLNTISGVHSFAFGENNTVNSDYSFVGGRFMNLSATADGSFLWGHATSAITAINYSATFIIYSGRMRINSGRKNYPNPIVGGPQGNLEIAADLDDLLTIPVEGDNSADIAMMGPSTGVSTLLGRLMFYDIVPPDDTLNISNIIAEDDGDVIFQVIDAAVVKNRFVFTKDANNNAVIRYRTNSDGVEYPVTSPGIVRTIRGRANNTGATTCAIDAGFGDPTEFASCVKNAMGNSIYTINFATRFTDLPIVMVTPINNASNITATIRSVTNTSFRVEMFKYSTVCCPVPAAPTNFMFEVTGRK